MQYVSVHADTLSEAMKKLRNTYGSDAIIIEEKEKKASGFLGRFTRKTSYTVKAAIREKNRNESGNPFTKIIEQPKSMNHVRSGEKNEIQNFLKILQENTPQKIPKEKSSEISGQFLPVKEFEELRKDIEFIKNNLGQVSPAFSLREFQQLADILTLQEFSSEWIKKFVLSVKKSMSQNDWNFAPKVFLKSQELLSSKIRVSPLIPTKRVISLVGSTGVGKTTTLAKLAARLKLKEGYSIELVTLDNFRIAATEQLKIYGNILDVSVQVGKSPELFEKIIKNAKADIILVDTTGTSPSNKEFISRLNKFFASIKNDLDTHLVMSATFKKNDMIRVMENFDPLGIDKIILSKIDESSSYGAFIELAESWHKPFSFLTNGQKVPDDFLEADRLFFAKTLLQNWKV